MGCRRFSTSAPRESVVLVYQEAQQYDSAPRPLRLRGLKPEATYSYENLTGAALMSHGIFLDLTGDYASKLIRLREVDHP